MVLTIKCDCFSINWLGFVAEDQCVNCDIETGCLNIILVNFGKGFLVFLYVIQIAGH
jgi:hypothetical protein